MNRDRVNWWHKCGCRGSCDLCAEFETWMPPDVDIYKQVLRGVVREETRICRPDGGDGRIIECWDLDPTVADDAVSLNNMFRLGVTPGVMRAELRAAGNRGRHDPEWRYRSACDAIWRKSRQDPRGPTYLRRIREQSGNARHGKSWSEAEVRLLARELLNQHIDLDAIAAEHGRSRRAIESKIERMGLGW